MDHKSQKVIPGLTRFLGSLAKNAYSEKELRCTVLRSRTVTHSIRRFQRPQIVELQANYAKEPW